jgi:hypothetical protein
MINKIKKITCSIDSLNPVSNYAQISKVLINFKQDQKKVHHHQSPPNLAIFD